MKKVKEVKVSETFIQSLVLRYSAYLGAKEVQRNMVKYSDKYYNTRKLKKRLKDIYNKILTSDDPKEIQRLRREYLSLRKQITDIVDKRNKDPKYKSMKEDSRTLREVIAKLDGKITAELQKLGYEIKPISAGEAETKIRELYPVPREAPESEGGEVAVSPAK